MKQLTTLLLLATIVFGSEQVTITPQFDVGICTNRVEEPNGVGGSFGGGVRISERHYTGLQMGLTRYIDTWEPSRGQPRNTLTEMQALYLFTPFLGSAARLEIGFSVISASDEYENHYGTWGIPLRLSIGRNRVHWFAQGTLSSGVFADLFVFEGSNIPSIASVTMGASFTIREK